MTGFGVLLVALALQQPPPPADLVVLNARVYTADVNRPVAEAFAVRGGRIAFVGSARGALALVGPRTERLDLAGRTVIPRSAVLERMDELRDRLHEVNGKVVRGGARIGTR